MLLQIKEYGKLESYEERREKAREIYDKYIMKELLARTHVSYFYCWLFLTLIS